MKSGNIKEIKNLDIIRNLITAYYLKYNITDQSRIENFISENNEKLIKNEIRCFIYEDEQIEGFLICNYYLDKKYIFYDDFFFNDNLEYKFTKITEFIKTVSDFVKDDNSYLFRVYLEYNNEEPELVKLLKEQGFTPYRRGRMVLELSQKYEESVLPDDYSFVDFDPERYKENRAISYDSYFNDTDGIIYPEVLEPNDEPYDVECRELSPHVEYEGKYVAFCNVEEMSDKEILVHGLSVKKEFQGKGLGRQIMNEILKRAFAKGLKKVYLTVSYDNTKAFNLYKDLGFKAYETFYAVNKIYGNK